MYNVWIFYNRKTWIVKRKHSISNIFLPKVKIVHFNVDTLKNFKTRFWDYYADLFKHKEDPKPEIAVMLSSEFDKLFS